MMCQKAVANALSILKDAEASFWDKAEAESYLEGEAIRPVIWQNGKAVLWRVECGEWTSITKNPTKVFCDWLHEALTEA